MRHLHTRSLPVTSLVARSTRAALVLGALAVLILSAAPRAQSTIKPYALESPAGLRLHNVTAEPATLDGKRGLRVRFDEALRRRLEAMTPQEREAAVKSGEVNERLAVIDGLEFGNGVIEAEIAGAPRTDIFKDARGFVGIAFRVQKDLRTLRCVLPAPDQRPRGRPGASQPLGPVHLAPRLALAPAAEGDAREVRVVRRTWCPARGPRSASRCAARRRGSSCTGRRSRR